MTTAIIAGGSGLTGQALFKRLLADGQTVNTLERRATSSVSANHHPLLVDYTNLPVLPQCDAAYCCLGTTIKKAGSKAAFSQVDFDYVVAFAQRAFATGTRQFLVISALDASTKSAIFYNRVKGEMEDVVAEIGFEATHIFQPSFLLGTRAESRLGEKLGIAAFKTISPLLVGGARKYRPIHVGTVAAAMLHAAKSPQRGVMRYTSDVIEAMGRGNKVD